MMLMIAVLLIVLCTVIHALFMMLALESVQLIDRLHPKHPFLAPARPILVAVVVLLMFMAANMEVLVWAIAYRLLGAFQEMEPAIYFSMVTFTTLGYGDIVLDEGLRILSSFQAAIGIIMFGWTTAIVLTVVQALYTKKSSGSDSRSPH